MSLAIKTPHKSLNNMRTKLDVGMKYMPPVVPISALVTAKKIVNVAQLIHVFMRANAIATVHQSAKNVTFFHVVSMTVATLNSAVIPVVKSN